MVWGRPPRRTLRKLASRRCRRGRDLRNAKDTKRQADAGIQTIKLEGAAGKSYHDKAYEAGWAGVLRQSPQHGPKLKEFFAKTN
jgi:hypothetical protein